MIEFHVPFSHLLARIDRRQIDFFVVFRSNVIQTAIVTERAPFHVDNHLLGLVDLAIPRTNFVQVFDVTRIGARAQNQTDGSRRVLVRARHQRPNGVIDQCHAFRIDTLKNRFGSSLSCSRTTYSFIDRLLQKFHDVFVDNARATEAFRPGGQTSRGKAFLLAREGECEAQRIAYARLEEILLLHEFEQAFGQVTE